MSPAPLEDQACPGRAIALAIAAITAAALSRRLRRTSPRVPRSSPSTWRRRRRRRPRPSRQRHARPRPRHRQPTPTPAPAPTADAGTDAHAYPEPAPTATPNPATGLVALPRLSKEIPGAAQDPVLPDRRRGRRRSSSRQTVAKSAVPCKSRTHDALACVSLGGGVHWVNTTNLATGSCTVTSVTHRGDPIVHLPRWAGPQQVRPALVRLVEDRPRPLRVARGPAHQDPAGLRQEAPPAPSRPQVLVGANGSSGAGNARLRPPRHKFNARDYSWQPGRRSRTPSP